ncbi:hypothetical protein E6Q11_02400 [Candidatus Dojkabacteria bacterium]|uniref:Uncharacterized protein n=1 Tax=Candidatus Dojkabacteria bacterium TaxID=2099670 RepID=A0A5C7J7X2_9BACT|nr:MAG: hypothetical protein E6Q11_02400 [Candidatus Dojkabacteria bacterium]
MSELTPEERGKIVSSEQDDFTRWVNNRLLKKNYECFAMIVQMAGEKTPSGLLTPDVRVYEVHVAYESPYNGENFSLPFIFKRGESLEELQKLFKETLDQFYAVVDKIEKELREKKLIP